MNHTQILLESRKNIEFLSERYDILRHNYGNKGKSTTALQKQLDTSIKIHEAYIQLLSAYEMLELRVNVQENLLNAAAADMPVEKFCNFLGVPVDPHIKEISENLGKIGL
jgi:hypothetical protein